MAEDNQPGLEKIRRRLSGAIAQPVVKVIARSGITPDMLTWLGFLLAVAGSGLVASGYRIAGGIVVLVGAACDMFDGALARYTGRVSKFGAILDSTLDRASEGALLIALAFILAKNGSLAGVALATAVMLFSFLVSYIRAREESHGLELKNGVFTRSERVLVLGLGVILGQVMVALVIVAFFSIITTVQRLTLVWLKTRAD